MDNQWYLLKAVNASNLFSEEIPQSFLIYSEIPYLLKHTTVTNKNKPNVYERPTKTHGFSFLPLNLDINKKEK